MSKTGKIILYFSLVILGIYFMFRGLKEAKMFLSPLVVSILLSMLVLPLARKFQHWGLSKGLAAFISDMIIVLVTFGFFLLITAQVQMFISDWPAISKRIEPKVMKAEQFIEDKIGVDFSRRYNLEQLFSSGKGKPGGNQQPEHIQKAGKEKGEPRPDSTQQTQTGQSGKPLGGGIFSSVAQSAMSFLGFLSVMLLVFIYVFFFLLYREKFRKSLLKMVPDDQREKTNKIVKNSIQVAHQYLIGRFSLILFLAIFYSIGLSIIGLKYAIFAGMIAAMLSLVPFIGNYIGAAIAISFALLSNDILYQVAGVLIVFTLAQFIENYLLQPYVIGEKVELNPVMIILIVVLGEAVWGVIGMVVAIPVAGIVKVFFDNIPRLQPAGYLLGNEDVFSDEGIFDKIKAWVKKVTGNKG